MVGVGLLRKKSGISYKTVLEDSDLYRNFKRAFTENFVLTEVLRVGIHPYFWRSGNTAELDFLFEYEDKIVPVEAKAEIHTICKQLRYKKEIISYSAYYGCFAIGIPCVLWK